MGKQTFQVDVQFLANINDLQTKLKTVTEKMSELGSSSIGDQAQKQFDRLSQSIQNLQTKAQQPIGSQAEFNKLTTELNRAQSSYNNLIVSMDRMKSMSNGQKLEMLPADTQARIQGAVNAIKAFEAASQNAANKQTELDRATQNVVKKRAEISGLKAAQDQVTQAVQRHANQLKELERIQSSVVQAEEALKSAQASNAGDQQIKTLTENLTNAKTQAELLGVAFTKNGTTAQAFSNAIKQTQTSMDKLTTGSKNITLTEKLATANTELQTLVATVNQLQGENPTAQLQSAFEELRIKAKSADVSLKGIGKEATSSNIDELKNRLIQLGTQGLQSVDTKIDSVSSSLKGDLKSGLDTARQGLDQASNSFANFNRKAQEVDQLKSQLGYFFSLTNTVYLFRSALQSTFETIKELDAVMTEAAVVTTNTVGDMWDKLPQYTAAASSLGATIKDVYAATTLYMQQGLEANAAMDVGIETMKMARIAGMDSAEATEAMTAALRGFNMEVNEMNASLVNDVYSELAAISASNTEQIATAMSKTASIAASANMEFETTAALLAQIIETTQEAPETAGTAMKTIIARFSEVKSLKEQGKTTGQDEEGEQIDVNKIQTALRTVGISMDEYFKGTEGLDQVLLRLAEKWDGLDFTTQRYIATMAAGSRQQSRFIAMMSDYERTTQLVAAANNSTGASQEQFNKTLESLSSKLNKLKTAWQQFLMNIADNDLIKDSVDFLTDLLTKINDITKSLPGATKSIANLALVFAALRIGGALVNQALSGISAAMAKGIFGAGVKAGVLKESAELGAEAAAASTTATKATLVASSEELSKTYRLIIYRVQATLPPVRATITTNPAAFSSVTAQMKTLQAEMAKTAASTRTNSAAYKNLERQYVKLSVQQMKAITAYNLEGASVQGLGQVHSKLLAAKIQEGAITTSQLALMDAESVKRYVLAAAKGDEAGASAALAFAEKTEQNLKRGGIIGLLTEIGLRAMGITTIEGEKVSLGGLIKLKGKEFIERMKNNAAMLNGLAITTAIIAAIVLLIIGIAKLVDAWKKAKNIDNQIEKINDSIGEMSEQVQEAAQKVDDLTEKKKELEELQDTFKNLTKGTVEWKQQLIKTNSAVLELIKEYPALSGYVQTGEYGQLTITDEGWDVALDEAMSQYQTLVTMQTGLQMQKNNLERQKAFEIAQEQSDQNALARERYYKSQEAKQGAKYTGAGIGATGGFIAGKIGGAAAASAIASSAFGGTKLGAAVGSTIPGIGTLIGTLAGALIGAGVGWLINEGMDNARSQEDVERQVTGGLTEEEFSKFAEKAVASGVSFAAGSSEEDFHEVYSRMGFDESDWNKVWSNMEDLGTDFDELANSCAALNLAQKAYKETLLTQIADNTSGLEGHEFKDEVVEAYALSTEDIAENVSEEAAEILDDGDYVDKGGEATDKMIEEYANAVGMTTDEVREKINNKALSTTTMANAIAQKEEDDKLAKQMTNTANALSKLSNAATTSKDGFDTLKKTLSESGSDLTKADQALIEEMLGMSIDRAAAMGSENAQWIVEDYIRAINPQMGLWDLGIDPNALIANWQQSVDAYAKGDNIAEKFGLDSSKLNQVNSGAYASLFEKLDERYKAGEMSKEEVQAIYDQIIGIMPKNAEQASQFLELLGNTNWDDLNELSSMPEMLGSMGVVLNGSESDFYNFISQVQEMNQSVAEFSTEDAIAKLVKLQEAIDKIQTSGEKTISGELFEKIKPNLGPYEKYFSKNNEDGTYTYVGDVAGSDKTLTQILQDATKTEISDEASRAKDEVLKADEVWENVEGGQRNWFVGERHGGGKVATGMTDTQANLLYYEMTGVAADSTWESDDTTNALFGNWGKMTHSYTNLGTGQTTTGYFSDPFQMLMHSELFDDQIGMGGQDYSFGYVTQQNNDGSYTYIPNVVGDKTPLWAELSEDKQREHWNTAMGKGYLYEQYFHNAYQMVPEEVKEQLLDNLSTDEKRATEEDVKEYLMNSGNDIILSKEQFASVMSYDNILKMSGVGQEQYGTADLDINTIMGGFAHGTIVSKDESDDQRVGTEETIQFMTRENMIKLYSEMMGISYEKAAGLEEITSRNDEDLRKYIAGQYDKYINKYGNMENKTGLIGTLAGYIDEFVAHYDAMSYEQLITEDPETVVEQAAKTQSLEKYIIQNNLQTVLAELEMKNEEQGLGLSKDDLIQLAMGMDSLQKKIKNVGEAMEGARDILVESKRETIEYGKQLNKLQTLINSNFGLNVDSKFMLQQRELIEKMVAGGDEGQKAFQEFLQKATDYTLLNDKELGWTQQQIDALRASIAALPTDVSMGITVSSSGFEHVGQQLQGMGEQFYLTQAQADAFAKTMADSGYAVEFQKVTLYKGILGYSTKPTLRDKTGETFITGYTTTGGPTTLDNPFDDGSSSGGSKYENSHDKFYNTYEKINALLREREKIERRYDRLLERRGTKTQDLVEATKQQIDLLNQEAEQQKIIEEGKLQEIRDLMSKNSKYDKYVTGFNETTGEISINWGAFEKIKDSEKGGEVDDYLSKLEELRDQWIEAQDTLEEIEDNTYELQQAGRDKYFDLEERVKEALEAERQEEIDKLSEINDSINDANSKILESLQQQIDEYRQNRENEKTEEELSDKQRRLAYLQQDTSGANAIEILNLQKEIEEGQESYTDQLIDQKISDLQKQNDEAAEQRERQIQLLEEQKEYYLNSGLIWTKAYELIGKGINDKGIIVDSDLWKLIAKADDFPAKSELEKLEWAEDLNDLVGEAVNWLTNGNTMSALLNSKEVASGETIRFTTSDKKELEGVLQSDGTIVAQGQSYTDVKRGFDNKYSTSEKYKGEYTPPSKPTEPQVTKPTDNDARGVANSLWFEGGGWGNGDTRKSRFSEFFDDPQQVQNYINNLANGKAVPFEGNRADYSYANMKKRFVAFETGGLADFTGPAWLDGTKSKPEYILNANQTKAFFQLVDVLSGFSSNSSQSAQNSGDTSFDIDIIVESISSDYDVEQLAGKIKSLINEDARYRNNNAINLMR